jgi:hypothetical protein
VKGLRRGSLACILVFLGSTPGLAWNDIWNDIDQRIICELAFQELNAPVPKQGAGADRAQARRPIMFEQTKRLLLELEHLVGNECSNSKTQNGGLAAFSKAGDGTCAGHGRRRLLRPQPT